MLNSMFLFLLIFCFLFIFKGKIPSDGVINEIKLYKAPRQLTILTLIISSFGMLFSLGCLIMNILYRKHRLVLMLFSQLIHVERHFTVELQRVKDGSMTDQLV